MIQRSSSLQILLCGALVSGMILFLSTGCGSRPPADVRATKNAAGQIVELKYFGQNVRDTDLKQIAEHAELKQLSFQECAKITPAGFARAMSSAARVSNLSIMRVAVTDKMLESLKSMTELRELELAHTEMTGQGLEHLADLPIERLVIFSRVITADGMVQLGKLTQLRELELHCQHISLAELPDLSKLTKLEKLVSFRTSVGADGLANLRGLPLKSLTVDCKVIGDEAIEVLNTFTDLEEGEFVASQFTDGGLKNIKLPKLKKLSLDGSRGITDSGLANLQGMPALETLIVVGTSVSCRDLSGLSSMKNLRAILIMSDQFRGRRAAIEALRAILPQCELIVLR